MYVYKTLVLPVEPAKESESYAGVELLSEDG